MDPVKSFCCWVGTSCRIIAPRSALINQWIYPSPVAFFCQPCQQENLFVVLGIMFRDGTSGTLGEDGGFLGSLYANGASLALLSEHCPNKPSI